jgi:hypothetical protein
MKRLIFCSMYGERFYSAGEHGLKTRVSDENHLFEGAEYFLEP